jgi:hypothetical protein
MANREINVNIQTDLEKIEADVIKDEKRKEVFFKWCEEEYGISIDEFEDIFEIFYHFSKDAKCHYETLIASYIILLDDMKSIMKAMLQTFANDDSENIEFDKQELKLWKEKAIENKSFIEKEITASKEMIKKLEEFLSFCKKYEEIRI